MTLQEIETALDSGSLWVAITNGRWWRARRNGRTQTWKRDPSRFRIPYKYGFRGTSALTEADLSTFDTYYKISKAQP